MTTHISARLAWHMDGWNGHICRNPVKNRYCIGPFSYPGNEINEKRDLDWETRVAGNSCSSVTGMPPCIYSINAFGAELLKAADEPPSFFTSGARTSWPLPPATVCIWPYEEMYRDEAKTSGKFDNAKRFELAKQFFAPIENHKSLVFHYSNYSNPLSTEDVKKYVVIGVARIKKLGDIEYYEGVDAGTKQKYAGGYIWQRNVETHYPDQGLRIPYHKYLDQPEVLERIALVPENSRCFKYASRHVSDDDALSLIEQFIEIVSFLRESGDTSEDWNLRLEWLNSLMAELWRSRGLFPGLARVFDTIGLAEAVTPFRAAASKGDEKSYCKAAFDWIEGKSSEFPGLTIAAADSTKIRRQWQLRSDEERLFLRDVLPRFDLPMDQIERILGDKRTENCVQASLAELSENPYLLVEQFVGDNSDDIVPFSRIDHGVHPSPDLGGDKLFDTDDWRRLRALAVGRLRYETKHTFLSCGQILQDVNKLLNLYPEWKQAAFTERYLQVDREDLQQAITFRKEGEREYAYLNSVYGAERTIEDRIRKLAAYSDIAFKSPVTEKHWRELLFEASSPLATKAREEYDQALQAQATVCSKIFVRPLSVVWGAAGTGKTTIIRAILQAIEKAHGKDATFLLLAPTGKAADRIREKTGKPASTIHSFLHKRQWLNPNLTLRPAGGQKEDKVTTFVIDEASMLNLELMATLFRAINWSAVQRLIIVGDPNQLPPIGRGKVFADIIDWLREHYPESLGELTLNLRQMENRVSRKGTGILDVASLYVRSASKKLKDEEESLRAEEMFQRLQDLPADGSVDKDLRVLFWKDTADLLDQLVTQMVADMEADTGEKFDPKAPHKLWLGAAKTSERTYRPNYQQVISPYLHEEFGTVPINLRLQQEARSASLSRVGSIAGITLFDKVMQTRNRGSSEPLRAWNFQIKANEPCEIFNGELGYVTPHGFDTTKNKWQWPSFRLKRFSVNFARKEHLSVGYGRELGSYEVNGRTKWIDDEPPEENLELAYAISVHKSQGSEFDRVYFILPKQKIALLSPELFYTGITRATRHCTIFVEQDVSPLLRIYRPEASHLVGINCSLFDFTPAPDGFELLRRNGYLEEFKIHQSLADVMVRSKSEVIIANMLFEREIAFDYEKPLYAPDGSSYLPDFTILWRGERYFWEHLGLLTREEYRKKWAAKKAWYDKHFPGRLVTTEESGNLSKDAFDTINRHFS
jgi:ATP-dependent exoDNAse (exonuclease V) alpha subunit